MSPRRKFEADEQPLFCVPPVKPSRRWGLTLVVAAASALIIGAVTVSSLVLVSHESQQQSARRDRAVLSYVRDFMAGFTSLDPFHANDYVERVLTQATGDFAKEYTDKKNEILLSVARAEPTKGAVLDAGVERWNDDGSASLLVATAVTSKSPDGKQEFENSTRWVLTAKQEGGQWKISSLQRVV
ncbi:mammalian cell entry protein [Mycobacterium sp.]|uniref:mammalian cell entry protein n=1 Tax=Mycobacterium sp. TaxID=1785 RepID=UPI0031D232F7